MKIDLEHLTYDELVALNHKIVERLKFLDAMHTYREMMQFVPGDQVSLEPPGRGKQVGTLVRHNKKTVTIITESGQKWNVSPHMQRKLKSAKEQTANPEKIIDFNKSL